MVDWSFFGWLWFCMYHQNFSRRISGTSKLVSNVVLYVFHPKVNIVNDTNKPTCLDLAMLGDHSSRDVHFRLYAQKVTHLSSTIYI